MGHVSVLSKDMVKNWCVINFSSLRCGQEKFKSIDKSYYRRAHGFVLMYDISNVQSFENVRKWIRAINETCDAKVPILIVGNKSDLRTATLQTKLIKQEQGELVARVNNFKKKNFLFKLKFF